MFLREAARRHVARRRRGRRGGRAAGKVLQIGYILRVHPSWTRFVEIGRTLGKPLVMRMNLNQQSSGSIWAVHKRLMRSTSPIVDCGVHYVDVMCQVTRAKPGRGARGRRAADRRDRAAHVQLRPSADRVRRRFGRLVRGRLGADDERDRVFRQGHDRAERLRVDRRWRKRAGKRNPPTTTATRSTNALRMHHADARAPTAASPRRTRSSRPKTSRAIRSSASASSACSSSAIRGEIDLDRTRRRRAEFAAHRVCGGRERAHGGSGEDLMNFFAQRTGRHMRSHRGTVHASSPRKRRCSMREARPAGTPVGR